MYVYIYIRDSLTHISIAILFIFFSLGINVLRISLNSLFVKISKNFLIKIFYDLLRQASISIVNRHRVSFLFIFLGPKMYSLFVLGHYIST